jgi:hypothetical protein
MGSSIVILGVALIGTLKRLCDLEVDVFMLTENLKNQKKD